MNQFEKYARYYDLLYSDKNYPEEIDYVIKLIDLHRPGARSLLNIGCGTGRHDEFLASKGYTVCGVDRSDEMLSSARKRGAGDYTLGDFRSVRLEKRFDVVMALFHVVSYLSSNEDVIQAFRTAYEHLEAGGIFLFDCWYGPGVLSDLPSNRVKRMKDGDISLVRIAEPEMHPGKNMVDVNYQLFIHDKNAGWNPEELKETHSMRYFFRPELELLCSLSCLSIVGYYEWFTVSEPTLRSWNACFVCKKMDNTVQ